MVGLHEGATVGEEGVRLGAKVGAVGTADG